MTITDDKIYEHLVGDYMHHLAWREKLFASFFVLMGALTVAYYSVHKNDSEKLLAELSWIIPLVGLILSGIFLLLDYRCHQILIARRHVGHGLEVVAMKKGLFASAREVNSNSPAIYQSVVLCFFYSINAMLCFFLLLHDAYG